MKKDVDKVLKFAILGTSTTNTDAKYEAFQ